MANWGYGPLEGDLALDVYEEFMRLYDAGEEALQVKEIIRSTWLPDVTGCQDKIAFFSATALALWETGCIRLPDIDELELALQTRPPLSDPMEEAVYSKAMGAFRSNLKLTPKRIRPRRKPRIPRAPILDLGDCICYSLGDEMYGGATVTRLNASAGLAPSYRLVPIRYACNLSPTLADFQRREWIMSDLSRRRREVANSMWGSGRVEDWADRPYHIWVEHRELKKLRGIWQPIGKIEIGPLDPTQSAAQDSDRDINGDSWVGETFGSFDSLITASKSFTN